MKKFLGKKPVMITFIALAVIMLVFYIGMLVRPVAIGMTYKGDLNMDYWGKMEMEVKVKTGSKADVKVTIEGVSFELEDVRYVENDRQVYIIMADLDDPMKMTDEEYKEMKKEILKYWDDLDKEGALMDVSAFSMGDETDSMTCVGSIVFAIIGGVITAALITFATLSTLVVLKKKEA